MASEVQQAPAAIPTPTADVVGNAFVHQYYHILHQSPDLVHRFYQDVSKLGRPEGNGIMSTTTTMQAINEKILSLAYGDFKAEITTVDAQDSHNGGVLVLVTGYLTGKDNIKRKFTQSFFLAPQDKGYFVLNDVFRYVDESYYQNVNQEPVGYVEAPHAPVLEHSQMQENNVPEQSVASIEEVNGTETHNPTENGDVPIEEEETPVPEVVDEIPDELQVVAETDSKVEDEPKKSYAYIVKVMKDTPLAVSHSPVRSSVKTHEQQVSAAVPAATPTAPVSDTQVSSPPVAENGNPQDCEAEGPSIYVKGLPLSATPAMLENEFKRFGPIKNGGIQVRSQKGFCFGFVEFEEASAVQSAIEASPIIIGGRKAVVEEKRSTSRGNTRGRSTSGMGAGYRNEGGRGRGSYSGNRGYGRGDYSNRAEVANRNNNRGGYANRGGDGYQKGESMGSNGGRVNRGPTINAAAKNVAPRISAPA